MSPAPLALKYLQEHNLLPVAMRVLPDAPGVQPQILREAQDVSLPNVDLGEILSMLDGNRTDELYKYLLLKLCAALSETLPGMFREISGATELLFPDGLLRADSVLGELANLPAVFLVEHCTHAFIEGFSCVEKDLLAIVPVHSILPFHVSCSHLRMVPYNIIGELHESCHCVAYMSDGVT